MSYGGNLVARQGLSPNETLIASDPPAHNFLRSRIEAALKTRKGQRLETFVAQAADRLVAKFAGRGEFDLVTDLASPLAADVLAEILDLGSSQKNDYKLWADAILHEATGSVSPERNSQATPAVQSLIAHLQSLIYERIEHPCGDLLSELLHGQDRLSAPQALNMAMLLVIAGTETTINLIGNAMLALLDHPLELERARSSESDLVELIEEALRYDSPVLGVLRRTTCKSDLAGIEVPEGAAVLLLLASANRDEQMFQDPDKFRLRPDSRRHLAFGSGVHFCLGASLARLEARQALGAVLRLRNLRRSPQKIERVESFLLRGPKSLKLRFDVEYE
jgi:cytochrome P450